MCSKKEDLACLWVSRQAEGFLGVCSSLTGLRLVINQHPTSRPLGTFRLLHHPSRRRHCTPASAPDPSSPAQSPILHISRPPAAATAHAARLPMPQPAAHPQLGVAPRHAPTRR